MHHLIVYLVDDKISFKCVTWSNNKIRRLICKAAVVKASKLIIAGKISQVSNFLSRLKQ